MSLETFSPESRLPEAERAAPPAFGDNPTKPFLDEGFQGGLLPVGHLAGFFKKAVWYLYGRFHMANHIISDTNVKCLFLDTMTGTGEIKNSWKG